MNPNYQLTRRAVPVWYRRLGQIVTDIVKGLCDPGLAEDEMLGYANAAKIL